MPQGERVAEGSFFGGEGKRIAFAHRGGSALWPENTVSAFAGAAGLGCTHIESDVRMTRDGQMVLFHDAELSRTTNGNGLLEDKTWEQLEGLDAGYFFRPQSTGAEGSEALAYPQRGQGHRIPRLSELLQAAPGAFFNIEIKAWGSAEYNLPEAFWRFIVDNSLQDRVLVAAEKHDVLSCFRKLSGGRVATGASRRECLQFLALNRLGLASRFAWKFQALQIPTHASGLRVISPSLLKAAHRQAIAVHAWTIDEADEMHDLFAAGVDGIMTDRPDHLMKVMSQLRLLA